MSIGSCTSCQPSASANAASDRLKIDRQHEDAAKAAREQAQQVQDNFKPDPTRLLDIQA